jgi:hypothetical protein
LETTYAFLHIVDSNIKPKAEGEKKTLLKHVAEENSRKYDFSISLKYCGDQFSVPLLNMPPTRRQAWWLWARMAWLACKRLQEVGS